ncbi:hypothetical protein EW146_g7469 [Bondarzewia mesenterica]|uniref:DUF6697 domain-containing protein n=1 Tax=Bondarzewia mesenterica TaxID=1095465 RepID=A0A4S4LKP5_9AGAM|nr:hypothetical protein EW146_g7469 [Bondarzewia mesenterica]
MESTQNTIGDLMASHSALNDKLRDAYRTIDDLKQQAKFSKERHDTLKKSYEDDLRQTRQERDTFRRDAGAKVAEVTMLRRQQAEQTPLGPQTNHEAEQMELVTLREANASLESQLAVSKAHGEEQTSRIDDLYVEHNAMKVRLDEGSIAEDKLRAEIARLCAESEDLCCQLDASKGEGEEKSTIILRAEEELNTLRAARNDAQEQLALLRASEEKREAEINRLRADNLQIQASLVSLQQQTQGNGRSRGIGISGTSSSKDASVQVELSIISPQPTDETEVIEISSGDEDDDSKSATTAQSLPPFTIKIKRKSAIQMPTSDSPLSKRRKLANTFMRESDTGVRSTRSDKRTIYMPLLGTSGTNPTPGPSSAQELVRNIQIGKQAFANVFKSYSIPSTVEDRIACYKPIAVPCNSVAGFHASDSYDGFVSRKFLCESYGYREQTFIGSAHSVSNDPHGKRRQTLFPQWDPNPGLPPCPGAPGTILSNRLEVLENPLWTVFLRAKSKALWIYAGDYVIEKSDKPLTPLEFAALPNRTRREWADAILKAKQWPCYTNMRARISLRKKRREISDEAIQAETRPSMSYLTETDVLKAMDRGEEILNVLMLRPSGYDEDFQRDMSEKFAVYDAKGNGSKATASTNGQMTKGTDATRRASAPRPRSRLEQEDLGEDELSPLSDIPASLPVGTYSLRSRR